MAGARAADRYAKSLLDLSIENNIVDKVHEDVLLINKTIDASRDLRLMLNSPIIQHTTKQKVMDSLFGEKVQKLTQAFFELITKNKRESLTHDIVKSFIRQYDVLKGIQKAVITTTYKISDQEKAAFEKLVRELTGKDPEIIEENDKDIIGGFVLNIGDRMIDASVRNKLKEIEFELSQ